MVQEGAGVGSPFLVKRKPSMGLSFNKKNSVLG